jgi:DNA-binding CsgD family transcriptional regulator
MHSIQGSRHAFQATAGQLWRRGDLGPRLMDSYAAANAVTATPVALRRTHSQASTHARRASAAWSPVVIAALLFAAIFSLRMAIHAPETAGICLLFVVPIALLTLGSGTRIGLVGAAVALTLLVLRTELQPVHVGSIFFVTRGFVFFAVPIVIALARRDAAARVAAAAAQDESAEAGAERSQQLTPRELEVLGLLAAGHTNGEIAEMLFLSVRTVESHRARLLRKLGRPTREELVLHARLHGLLSDDGAALPQLG